MVWVGFDSTKVRNLVGQKKARRSGLLSVEMKIIF
jgi:hypothetical protein